VLAVWFVTTASSCQTTFGTGGGTVHATDAAAAAGIAVVLVGAGIYCLVDLEDCFLDEEALRAKAAAHAQAQAAFVAGLRQHQAGDPKGLERICLSAHRGYANAQYFYGVRLVRKGNSAGGATWLRRAAVQGHREADILLRQMGGSVGPNATAPAETPAKLDAPTFMACTREG
jgi:hypothetical protein